MGHGWFSKGSRTGVKVSLGFKNFYIYSAVNINSGQADSLLMPYVDTACFNVFLEEVSRNYKNTRCLLILDGASWHRSANLKVPDNIELMFLPPYSPELNPIERLWGYIKKHTIRNKFYDSIWLLENAVCDFIKQITEETIKSICSCNYLYSYL